MALATFLAITLIEEVGKVKLIYDAATHSQMDKKKSRNHTQKYAYAVFLTLFVNSRVTDIYGTDEAKFARWFREGELFRMRNRALYAEFRNDRVVLPDQAIQRDDAFLLVCIAGEVLAEIQGEWLGTGAEQWQQMINEVDTFRTRHGRNDG
jgi:AbiV family abortive infection protein